MIFSSEGKGIAGEERGGNRRMGVGRSRLSMAQLFAGPASLFEPEPVVAYQAD